MRQPTDPRVKIFEWVTGNCALGGKSVLSPGWWHATGVVIPESKLFYVIDGEIEVEIGDEKIVARRGDMMLIPAGVRHSYRLTPLAYAEKFWCHFSLEASGVPMLAHYTIPYRVTVGENARVLARFTDLCARLRGQDRLDEIAVLGDLYSLVAIYLEYGGARKDPAAEDEIDALIREIRRDPAAGYTLEKLARRAHLSPNYLVRKFHARVGMPPMKYLNRVRMETARALLTSTDLPLAAVMDRVGATDPANFSRSFKLAFGYPPNAYRNLGRPAGKDDC